MILDSLAHWGQYRWLSPHFPSAFAFLETITADAAVGRHEIAGDDVFAFVQQHETKLVETCRFEAHRQYLDIQYILRGREIMHWAPLPTLTEVTMPFDADKDAALYARSIPGVPVPVLAGQFTIFFPGDGHIPSCAWDDVPAEVLKVVVKVRVA
ncbi:YhcH/YjgK/YiaL family protein [Synoicihabitans lomoniglobus]|uniref:YhcH/YjgK/YiaL family protein n=1 Tax=Synoicihabitans lomoniglobus TaxID=2909285 RepID=A0AAE9ZSZ7_9BACT|nr:YhcH/YjgK/YiaL family protein [Opitutaceae bacterium LMO-M01]WED63706.1 YhcH/YjgK/YiaL family protein [Opitutaceae bacterium LMO-M01]